MRLITTLGPLLLVVHCDIGILPEVSLKVLKQLILVVGGEGAVATVHGDGVIVTHPTLGGLGV